MSAGEPCFLLFMPILALRAMSLCIDSLLKVSLRIESLLKVFLGNPLLSTAASSHEARYTQVSLACCPSCFIPHIARHVLVRYVLVR